MGWILESNKSMNRAMEGMGGTVVRRYRFYERLFEEAEEGEESIADAVPIGVGAGVRPRGRCIRVIRCLLHVGCKSQQGSREHARNLSQAGMGFGAGEALRSRAKR
jgi:hypothetical protein